MLRSQSDESDKSHVGGDGTSNPEARSDDCKRTRTGWWTVWQSTLQTGRVDGWVAVGYRRSIRGHCVAVL